MADQSRERIAAAVRELADLVARSGAAEAELEAVAQQLEAQAARLRELPHRAWVHDSPFHPVSLVGGRAHPTGPQLYLEPDGRGVAGIVTLGAAYEGGPGLVHGGVLSLMFDHAMGTAVFVAGHAAMTVSLEVRYRAPTPLETPLQVSAWVDRVDGRKVFVGAEMRVEDELTATATSVFLRLTRENVERIFPAARVPADEPEHLRDPL
jgi:acyl-coenzyme A thioesterase PaaI-like protein